MVPPLSPLGVRGAQPVGFRAMIDRGQTHHRIEGGRGKPYRVVIPTTAVPPIQRFYFRYIGFSGRGCAFVLGLPNDQRPCGARQMRWSI